MLLEQIYYLFDAGELHDYPLITFKDDNNLTIRTDNIRYCDLMKLMHYNIETIGTTLPFTIKLMCDFKALDIKGASL